MCIKIIVSYIHWTKMAIYLYFSFSPVAFTFHILYDNQYSRWTAVNSQACIESDQ